VIEPFPALSHEWWPAGFWLETVGVQIDRQAVRDERETAPFDDDHLMRESNCSALDSPRVFASARCPRHALHFGLDADREPFSGVDRSGRSLAIEAHWVLQRVRARSAFIPPKQPDATLQADRCIRCVPSGSGSSVLDVSSIEGSI